MPNRSIAFFIVLILFLPFSVSFSERADQSAADPSQVLSFGDRVLFGRYEQDGDTENGAEEIRWIVLDNQGDRVLLISDLALDRMPYHPQYTDITWENCSLRAWLNQDFLETAFTEEEKNAIRITEVDNSPAQGAPGISADGGNDTQDRIFLLSYDECSRYLGAAGLTACQASPFAETKKPDKPVTSFWWLRSPGKDLKRAWSSKLNSSPDGEMVHLSYGWVRPVLWADLTNPAFAAAAAQAKAPAPSVLWNEYLLTPVYYEYSGVPNGNLSVRFSCEDVPLQLLYDERENFLLVDQDGEEKYRSIQIRVMEHEVRPGSPEITADYFDVVFDCSIGKSQDISGYFMRFGDSGQILPLPARGSEDPSNCVFVTHDGMYVISLFSSVASKWIAYRCQDSFDGADIRMCLTGTDSNIADSFLNRFEFASLELTVADPLRLNRLDHPEIITCLAYGSKFLSGVYPSVTSLSYYLEQLNHEFLFRFDECFPALKELTLLIGSPDQQGSILSSRKDLESNTCSHLESLTITVPEGTVLPEDPDLRVWIGAQREAAPGMNLNGRPASEYDLSEGLQGEALQDQIAYSDRKEVAQLFRSSGSAASGRDIAPEDFGNQILFCVTGDHPDDITYLSTESSKAAEFREIPGQRLASSLTQADTLVRIYPAYFSVGTYRYASTGKLYADAKACEVHVAVYSFRNGEAVLKSDQAVYTAYPPENYEFYDIPTYTTAYFYPHIGVDHIASLLKE